MPTLNENCRFVLKYPKNNFFISFKCNISPVKLKQITILKRKAHLGFCPACVFIFRNMGLGMILKLNFVFTIEKYSLLKIQQVNIRFCEYVNTHDHHRLSHIN